MSVWTSLQQGILSTGATAGEEPETLGTLKTKMVAYFTDPLLWTTLLLIVVKIAAILIVSRLFIKVAHKTANHFMSVKDRGPIKLDTRRTHTIGKLFNNVISYIVNFIAVLLILKLLGFDLAPFLAGAGVLGLAIGFGAQSLVKDVITGFFIIFEDQFAVGDIIQTGTFKGTVEEIGLRVTRIRSWTGEVHIIPNGSITQVTNFSVNNSLAVVDVSISSVTDIDRALTVIKETVSAQYEAEENMMKEPDVLGVQSLNGLEIVIRVTAECMPNTHFAVGRKLNAEIKKALDEHGIAMPTLPGLATLYRTETK
ncbi:mechanosensitive ion channel family protein [Paenibacillus sp. y28]|uniref:mechanosensitive ion channel family protein n=1 Tax=Paenibacillus sp. y28 TaxID=3129110 RepID=UPI0030180A24